MKTRILFPSLLLLVGLLGNLSLAVERPNIVIIMSDDSGYTDLGCYGGEIDTPNLDKLASRGMRLSNFYTNGRCSPTRASLLTGLDCIKVGFGGGSLGGWWREFNFPAHRGRLPYNTPLLPELLKESGYKTLMSGKWHMGGSLMKNSKQMQATWKETHKNWPLTPYEIEQDFLALPAQRGFDQFFGIYDAQDNLFFTPGQGHPYYEGNTPAKLSYDKTYSMHCWTLNPNKRYQANHGKTGKAWFATAGVTDRAIEMLEAAEQEDDEPFLMYIAYRAPHLPLQASEEQVQKYLPRYSGDLLKVADERVKRVKELGLYPKDAKARKKWVPADPKEQYPLRLALHAGMVESIDENVGRVIETLEELGETENTLVLYFSDNGNASHMQGIFNAPYHGTKALTWEGGTKSHFIATWPGKIEANSINHSQAWVGDVLPTCMELAGLEYPASFREEQTETLDGRSLTPVFKGEERIAAETIFLNDKGQQSLIYKGRWKLLVEPGWYSQTQEAEGTVYELYDLEADPAETNNLAEKMPEMVQDLNKQCEAWKKEHGLVVYGERVKIRPSDPY